MGRTSQWLFNHGRQGVFAGRPGHYYQVVISASHALLGRSREAVLAEVRGDLESIWPDARGAELLHWRAITHRAAVFSMRPGIERLRPPQQTAIPNLMLAGDWTATGWPATMEGAVRSGYLAVEAIAKAAGRNDRILVPDLPRGWLTRLLFGAEMTLPCPVNLHPASLSSVTPSSFILPPSSFLLHPSLMLPYRLLAIDIDGTLVNSRDELTPATRAALRRAGEAGIHVVLATGRRYSQTLHLVEPLEIDVPLVTASGALVKDPLDHRTLYRAEFEPDCCGRRWPCSTSAASTRCCVPTRTASGSISSWPRMRRPQPATGRVSAAESGRRPALAAAARRSAAARLHGLHDGHARRRCSTWSGGCTSGCRSN